MLEPSKHTMFDHKRPVAYPGGRGFSGVQPPPRSSEGPPKNRAKLNPTVKTVKKLLNSGCQHTKMFGKKGSKILKLPRFAIVLH